VEAVLWPYLIQVTEERMMPLYLGCTET